VSVREAVDALDLDADQAVAAVPVADVPAGPAVDLVAADSVLGGETAVPARAAGDLVQSVEVREVIVPGASPPQVGSLRGDPTEVRPLPALRYVPADRLLPCTNCGMVPLRRQTARDKLRALGAGAALVRQELTS